MLAVGRGATTKATARELGVSSKTVEYHLGNIYRKLDVQGRAELAHLVGSLGTSVHRAHTAAGNLPHERSLLVGRERPLAELRKAIDEHRLVSVVGAGGVGKTRVALEACRRIAPDFRDGAWLVGLAPIADPRLVGTTMAAALGLQLRDGIEPGELVAEVLAPQQRLLLIDNCEHLIDAVAVLIDGLGARCPEVTVLTTTRQRLELDGELVFPLPPLTVDAEDDLEVSEAVLLFCDRAALVLGRFEPGPDELGLVDRICHTVDGLPLAIELAAAQLERHSLDELSAALAERFDVLTRARGAPDRQLSLRATVAWSYDLLDPVRQTLFDDVSTFLGGFDATSAEILTADPAAPAGLRELTRASLIESTTGPLGSRYEMLETVRQFGADRQRARGVVRDRRRGHLTAMLDFAERANQGVRSADEQPWHGAFLAEWPNLEAAFSTACEEADTDGAYRLISATFWWGLTRLRFELARWTATAIDLPGGYEHPLRPTVSAAEFFFTLLLGGDHDHQANYARAVADDERLGAVGEPWVPCVGAWGPGTSDEKLEANRSVERRGREQGSFFWVVVGACQEAMQLNWGRNVGQVSTEAAVDQARRTVALADRLGNPNGIAFAALALGGALSPVDLDEAMKLYERSLALAEPLGVDNTSTQARRGLITAYTRAGRPREALALAGPALARHHRAGSALQATSDLLTSSAALAAAGRPDIAAAVVGWFYDVNKSTGHGFGFPALEVQLRENLGSAEVDRIFAESAALTEPHLIELVLQVIDDLLTGSP